MKHIWQITLHKFKFHTMLFDKILNSNVIANCSISEHYNTSCNSHFFLVVGITDSQSRSSRLIYLSVASVYS